MKKALLFLLAALLLCGCAGTSTPTETAITIDILPSWEELVPTGTMELSYAAEFSVTYYDVYSLIETSDGSRYLLIPESAAAPKNVPSDITLIQQPLDTIYLASTSSMDYYRAIGGMDAIKLSSLNESGWFLPEVKAAMAEGKILYAGKYSAPDYELIYANGCDLALESTMILHTPEVKEQLQRLGVPVFVERSSYEKHPLGRMEWMKLHGLLIGRREEAAAIYDAMTTALQPILNQPGTGKTVAFFSVSSTGLVTVRKSSDYVAKTIALAGGQYIFTNLGDDSSATSTLNMQMESFFDTARDADVLIYNASITGAPDTLEDLFTLSPLFREFSAVKTGQVYTTGKNLFQEPLALGDLISEIHSILTGDADYPYEHLRKLN